MNGTPARNTRSQSRSVSRARSPLPAIPARMSLAYGSQGTAEIRGQVAAPGTSMSAGFARKRLQPFTAEIPREEDEDAQSTSARSSSVAPVARSERRTTIAASASPERKLATAVAKPSRKQRNDEDATQRTETVVDDAAYVSTQAAEPSFWEIFRHAIFVAPGEILHDTFISLPNYLWTSITPANLKWFIKNFMLFGLIFWLIAYMSLLSNAGYLRDQLSGRLSRVSRALWDLPTSDASSSYGLRSSSKGNVPDKNLLSRLDRLEAIIQGLSGDLKIHDATFAYLETILPAHIAMRDRVDSMDVPQDFWTALADKMTDQSGHPIWDAFMAANTQRIASLSENSVRDAMAQGQVIDKATFASMLAENNEWLREQYAEEFDAIAKRNLKSVKKIVESETSSTIQRSSSMSLAQKQLETLVNANELHNMREVMRSVNYFSPGNGASVIPHLTSPTASSNNKFFQLLYHYLVYPIPFPHKPIVALHHWNEGTECWCASPSEDARGKAQLAVHMGQKVWPEQVVVEHIPAQGTLNIAAAPRKLEFWAAAETAQQAEEFKVLIAQETPQVEEYTCTGEPPAPEYVCIGKGNYEIHGTNWVQSFPMFADTQALGFATRNVAVKSIENWGSGVTCMYRVRLVGERP